MSFELLSRDHFTVIFENCSLRDVLSLSLTNRHLHDLVYSTEYLINIFHNIYGSLAKSEETIPLHKLTGRIKNILDLGKTPYIHASKIHNAIKFFFNICPSQVINQEQAFQISKHYLHIAFQLATSSTPNLPDLRNKCLRLQTLETELSKLEMGFSIKLPALDFLSNPIYRGKWIIPMGDTSICIKGVNTSISIIAYPKIEGRMYRADGFKCALITKQTHMPLSEMLVHRIWRNADGKDVSERSLSPKQLLQLEMYKLQCAMSISELSLMHIPETGDFPLQRLMLQIAVEIFMHDPAQVLEIIPCDSWNTTVDAAGGFTFKSEYSREIQEQFKNARAKGKLFAERSKSHKVKNIELKKYPLLRFQTQFVKPATNETASEPSSGFLEPVLVDFSIDKPPIIWEEMIAQSPLLNLNKSFQLPIFWSSTQDYLNPSKKISFLSAF
jgi:hypothetical protein